MIETDFDRMVRRADSLYGERQNAPAIPAVYVVEPRQMPKQGELEQARALVLAALRELPELMLLAAALAVVGIRHCWLWMRRWKKTGQVG